MAGTGYAVYNWGAIRFTSDPIPHGKQAIRKLSPRRKALGDRGKV
jgi:hypothetical protein